MGGLQVLETVSSVASDEPSPAPKLVRWFALVFRLSATVSLRETPGAAHGVPTNWVLPDARFLFGLCTLGVYQDSRISSYFSIRVESGCY